MDEYFLRFIFLTPVIFPPQNSYYPRNRRRYTIITANIMTNVTFARNISTEKDIDRLIRLVRVAHPCADRKRHGGRKWRGKEANAAFLRRVPVQAAFNGTVATQRIIINFAARVTGSLRSNRAKILSVAWIPLHGSAVLTRNINRWKLWRSIQVSDGREKRGSFSRNSFARLRLVDSGRAFPLRVPIVCSIVPSRLIYRQPMPRGIRELVFP